ncbi:MAG TPA: response regulator [Polyangiaceae bacterium]
MSERPPSVAPDVRFATPPAPWRTALTAAPLRDPPRVLLAEDDDEMRQLVAEALRSDGYDVIAVSDGGRLLVTLALELIGNDDRALVDLLVLDVRMPIRSGMQVLEQLRAGNWRVPTILMTAFADPSMRERAIQLGAMLFDKPFDLDDLRTAASCLLRRTI